MKKIPTLFKRVFSPDHKTKTILPEVTPGYEVVLEGRCIPTVKWDGACCAIINGEIYKRYDAKIGKGGKQKQPPEGAIPCQSEPDPITGHWPHWVKCDSDNPADKYFLEALTNFRKRIGEHDFYNMFCGDDEIRTLEAVGPAWQDNPYGLSTNDLIRHGRDKILELSWAETGHLEGDWDTGIVFVRDNVLSFEMIRDYLRIHEIEGIVFWMNEQPLCKIKRSDFGFEWPINSNKG